MSKNHEAHTEVAHTETPVVEKKKRAPAKPRTVYAVIEVLDEDGNAVPFDKTRLRLVNIETRPDRLIDLLEGGEHPRAVLLKGIVAPGR